MNDQEKFEALADVLDTDAAGLTAESKLEDLNWDSMAMLSVIALARANGKKITGAEVRAFQTVGDLVASVW